MLSGKFSPMKIVKYGTTHLTSHTAPVQEPVSHEIIFGSNWECLIKEKYCLRKLTSEAIFKLFR